MSDYWQFLNRSRRLRTRLGQTARIEGRPELYAPGLHASARAIDALTHARGPFACLVTLGGEILHDIDQSAGQERTPLWIYNASGLLRVFACDEAEAALLGERAAGREPDPRSFAGIEVMRRFLRGDASEKEADAAADITLDASTETNPWATSWSYATWAAVRSAAWAVDGDIVAAASGAVSLAAKGAGWLAMAAGLAPFGADYGAVKDAAKDASSARLTAMLMAAKERGEGQSSCIQP